MRKFLIVLACCLIFLMNNSTALRCSALGAININTASATQLEEIISVGPVIAQKIIDARPFSSIDDLLRVSGIGPKTLQKIKEQGLACIDCATQENLDYKNQDSSQTQASGAPTITPAAIAPAVSDLQNGEKSDISNKVEGSPWFLFFTTLITTLALAGIVLFIKFKFLKENVRT